jgi:NSS family neurotransmitter:Na+ symporter
MPTARDHWSSRLGFVLAAAGSAVGLGNLWKFPFITWSNEGGAFVLVYLLCIAAVGLPIMMAEILVGRKTQKAAVGGLAAAIGPVWGWVGGLGVFTGFVILGYYTVIAGWTLRYFWRCLEWSFGGFQPGFAAGDAFNTFVGNGSMQVVLAGFFMALTMFVIFKGVGGGIERVARVLMPTLFVIILLLLFSAVTMDGASRALSFIFVPDFSKLQPRGALEALGHAFFTLSLGMGAMITYGSYMSRRESVVRASSLVVLLDTVIALFATIIMFSVIFSKAGMSEQVAKSTAGMLFITLPELFYTVVPLGNILAPLFYLLVAFAALTSTISLLEVVVSYFIDQRGWSRRTATTVCGLGTFGLSALCGLSFGSVGALSGFSFVEGKEGLFLHLDHLASNWLLPLGGFFITLGVGWFMTREASEAELVDETTPSWFSYGVWRVFMRYVAPLAVAAIIAAVISGKDFS